MATWILASGIPGLSFGAVKVHALMPYICRTRLGAATICCPGIQKTASPSRSCDRTACKACAAKAHDLCLGGCSCAQGEMVFESCLVGAS